MNRRFTDLLIVGGGPAGMMAGLLFARAGLRVTVIEKHGDFLRDFRGDTVHPSTLELFHELGLLHRLLKRPHDKVSELSGRVAGREVKLADFSHLPVKCGFIAMMPQWELLDFLNVEASRYPAFSLRMNAEASDLLYGEAGCISGIRLKNGENIRARLVIAADGRHSRLRQVAALPLKDIGAPMDVFWFRLPKKPEVRNQTMGVFQTGRIFVQIDRNDYWQCAYVFPKGGADRVRGQGLAHFHDEIAHANPDLAEAAKCIRSWDDVKLLSVTLDRLTRWYAPGILAIGDAAHAMSPVGGVGINLAIQDAVAAANILAEPMAGGKTPDPLLHLVQHKRMGPTRHMQSLQKLIQDRIIGTLLESGTELQSPPLAVRLLDRFPLLRRIPARIVGLGFGREHIRSPSS